MIEDSLFERLVNALERIADSLENNAKFVMGENESNNDSFSAGSSEDDRKNVLETEKNEQQQSIHPKDKETQSENKSIAEHTIYSKGTDENNPIENYVYKKEVDVNGIINYFKVRNVEIKTFSELKEENKQFDIIVRFMGERFYLIETVYKEIKKALNRRDGKFSLYLGKMNQDVISSSCQLCVLLNEKMMLSEYNYQRSPKYQVNGRVNLNPNVINFLTGHWLEHYVRIIILKVICSLDQPVEYTYMMNAEIKLPNGNDFELDIVFMVNNLLYWVEAKTENPADSIEKYKKISKTLGIDSKRVFLVSLDQKTEKDCDSLSHFYGLNMMSIDLFEQKLLSRIKENLSTHASPD